VLEQHLSLYGLAGWGIALLEKRMITWVVGILILNQFRKYQAPAVENCKIAGTNSHKACFYCKSIP
jgi:hypothetical protein